MIAELYQNRFNEAHSYYYNGDFSLIKEKSAAFFENENLPCPSDTTQVIVNEGFMRAHLQFPDYMCHT